MVYKLPGYMVYKLPHISSLVVPNLNSMMTTPNYSSSDKFLSE